jgi:hypothetical protein
VQRSNCLVDFSQKLQQLFTQGEERGREREGDQKEEAGERRAGGGGKFSLKVGEMPEWRLQ